VRRRPDLQRVHPNRFQDVLELGCAEIADLKIEPSPHLAIGVLGEADCAGLCDALQTRGDIDAVAHQVAVGFLDHVSEMNADAEFDPSLGGQARVALNHGVLHLDGETHGVDHAAELDQRPVAGALHDPPVVNGDRRVDEVASERPEPRQRAILVGAGEPAEADHVGGQDRREFPGLAHAQPPLPRILAWTRILLERLHAAARARSSVANSSSASEIAAAPTFSSRCATLPVPGIGSITGLRLSNQASAIWPGVA